MTCELPLHVSHSHENVLTVDRYPPKMIPGCHVVIHTTAKDDRDARLLLTQVGIPFYGRLIN